ncbi:MAG: peptidase S15, partial [Desulfovibrionaceae bacterium]
SALDATVAMDQPEAAPGLAKRQMSPAESRWSVERDLASKGSMLKVVKDAGRVRLEDEGVEYWRRAEERYSVDGDEPASAAGEACSTWGLAWEGVSVETRSRLLLRGDEEAFEVQADLDAYEGNRRVFARSWSKRIRRRDV